MLDQLEKNKKLYSFDLFDTLIYRPLKRPFHVFDLVECTGVVHYRFPGFGVLGFRRWRVMAERVARKLSKKEDISIWQIYRVLGWVVLNPGKVLKQELALERALLKPIPENVRVVASLVDQGKQCCIVTDMYLPLWFLRKIVQEHVAHGINIFASSSFGVTKHSGNLYKLVAEHYGLDFSEIQHVGDNHHSDCIVPERLGMAVNRMPDRSVRDGSSSIFEYFAPHDDFQGSTLAKLGYSLVGPACVAFAKFIKDDVERRGIDKVFFCARDTYLIKEAFDRLAPESTSCYLRLSRRALYVPAFSCHKNKERLFERRISGREFFERIDVVPPESLVDLDPCKNKPLFMQALKESDFFQRSEEDAAVLLDYLENQDFSGNVALVDLGWRGTLQESLKSVIGKQCKMTGYYFGSIVRSEEMHGFYFNDCAPRRRFSRIFQALPVFEFLFTEPVRSLKRICHNNGEFGYEYVDDEQQKQIELRQEIAKGCRQFIEDYGRVANILHCDSRLYLRSLDVLFNRYLNKPDAEIIEAFDGIGHAEGFGGSKYAQIVNKEAFTFSGYRNSYWRAAYVSTAKGFMGFLGRRLHSVVYSPMVVGLIYKRHGLAPKTWRLKRGRA